MNRVELKREAKKTLKKNYNDSLLIVIIYFAIAILAGFLFGFIAKLIKVDTNLIQIGQSIVSLLISLMVIPGFYSYFLKISRNKKTSVKELFAKTDFFIPILLIYLLSCILVLLWSILFIIPGIIASFCYSQIYLVYLDNPKLKVTEVLKESKKLIKGYKMDYFILNLSFIGWSILAVFTFGLLYIWLIPYIVLTQINFYNELIKIKNK